MSSFIALDAISSSAPKSFIEQGEYKSETEETVVRVYRDALDALGQMQLRVFRNREPKSDGFVLWEGENRVSILVSSDGEGIAVNHHAMSDLGLLLVFTRREDGTYEKIEVDFQKEVLALFRQHERLKETPTFDHIYCYAKAWLTSDQLLGVLTGHQSGDYSLSAFWFIFDCSTKRFSFDLHEVNTGAFEKKNTAQKR